MAVGLKTSDDYGYSFLPLFGVDPHLISAAKVCGVVITQTSPGNFTVKSADGLEFYGTIPVKGSAISLAKSGNLGPASKQAIKYNFEAALKKAVSGSSSAKPSIKLDSSGEYLAPLTEATAQISKLAAEPSYVVGSGTLQSSDDSSVGEEYQDGEEVESLLPGAEPALTADTIMKGSPCKLSFAKSCYQPVMGTTNGAVYYVAAMFPGLNLAMRVKGNKVSFRAEGTKLTAYLSALGDLGFSNKDTYASVHFEIQTKALLLKTVGAIIGRLGIHLVRSTADPLTLMKG